MWKSVLPFKGQNEMKTKTFSDIQSLKLQLMNGERINKWCTPAVRKLYTNEVIIKNSLKLTVKSK